MRTLGIDYGRTRIGLAAADPTATIVSPIGYIINKGAKKNLAALADICKKHDIGAVVLGLPLLPDGTEGDMAQLVRSFGESLSAGLGLPVSYQDERLTSVAAEWELREKMGMRDPKKIAETVDSIAASMILKDYLQNKINN
jgi:putative Holliday junction resolvase